LAVYRIVQESLTNGLRHAGPGATAAVSVTVGDAYVTVSVDDDGRGVAGAERPAAEGSGTGIAGMRERTAAFGGTLSAGPGPGGGWRVEAVLPLAPDAGPERPLPSAGEGRVTA
jgi:signal transduction histidine kinase